MAENKGRIDLSTAGIKVAYAFETVLGTRPTTGWIHIPGISTIPSMNESPNMINTTTLDETVEEVGVPGLKSLPSATGFTANYTNQLNKQWKDIMAKYETAKSSDLRMWLAVVIPGVDDAFYFTVEPSPLGVPGADVGGVLSIDLYLTKTNEVAQAAKPTTIEEWPGTDLNG